MFRSMGRRRSSYTWGNIYLEWNGMEREVLLPVIRYQKVMLGVLDQVGNSYLRDNKYPTISVLHQGTKMLTNY